jgi:hypothetical protein
MLRANPPIGRGRCRLHLVPRARENWANWHALTTITAPVFSSIQTWPHQTWPRRRNSDGGVQRSLDSPLLRAVRATRAITGIDEASSPHSISSADSLLKAVDVRPTKTCFNTSSPHTWTTRSKSQARPIAQAIVTTAPSPITADGHKPASLAIIDLGWPTGRKELLWDASMF